MSLARKASTEACVGGAALKRLHTAFSSAENAAGVAGVVRVLGVAGVLAVGLAPLLLLLELPQPAASDAATLIITAV